MSDAHPTDAADRLIVALDVPTRAEALALTEELQGITRFYKVGYQLFIAAGLSLVHELIERGHRVFLDLKMDDVGETISLAVREIARASVDLITVNGGAATVRAAVKGRGDRQLPRILSLTLLSSMNEADLAELHLVGPTARFRTTDEYVLWRARMAVEAGCDGLIASGQSVRQVREAVGPVPLIVTPGVRSTGSPADDHKRSLTPREAIEAGSTMIVVGRPITRADDRRAAALSILAELPAAGSAERDQISPRVAN
ncbi:MAG: orotidine-5'-phosphate decarboxylase [Gemmatimonadota bacterium]